MTTNQKRPRALLALVVACSVGCGVDDEQPGDEATNGKLIGGTLTNARPEIGLIGGCTGTLVDSRFVLTAGHCFNFFTGPVSGLPFLANGVDSPTTKFQADRVYSFYNSPSIAVQLGFGDNIGMSDVALVRLSSHVSPSVATPAVIAPVLPAGGTQVTQVGFGCTDRNNEAAGQGMKRFRQYFWGQNTQMGCPGDSGGPSLIGTLGANGPVFAVTSGFTGSGNDVRGNAVAYGRTGLTAVRKFGSSTVANVGVNDFPSFAQAPGAKILGGDFNGDGFGDLAITGPAGWGSVPVAFGNSVGGFTVQNRFLANFPGWASQPGVQPVAGDFDGDGDTDIAITGGSGWGTVPVAFSNRDGTFTVSNLGVAGGFPGFAAQGGRALAGDFDGDGDADIALSGKSGWTTIPVAFSNRNGTFTVTNQQVSQFPGWAATGGARLVAGDFNGDGRADLAVTGVSGWTTIPVATSNGSGGFTATNRTVDLFPGWAATAGVKFVTGDFDFDGDADIAAMGGSSWNTIAFALSDRGGAFTTANFPIADAPTFAAHTGVQIVAVNADNFRGPDIILAGGSGWGSMPVVFLNP